MLRDILIQNNLSLLNEVEQLLNSLIQFKVSIPAELDPYFHWLLNHGKILLCNTRNNLTLLDYKVDLLLPDILSKTQVITYQIRLFDDRFITPIYRFRPSDRLCLKILTWLHLTHTQTQNMALAFSDGGFACLPVSDEMSMYFIPPSTQQSFLYLPLLFHEFGHILYACHEQEMNDLVGELQEEIAELLQPASQRSDRYSQHQAMERKKIVEVWHEWTQELFCDAVGFQIGGAAFIRAFSGYLQMLGRSHFHIPQDKLAFQAHPVSWLRVKILVGTVRQHGYDDLAQELEDTWNAIALSMGIIEDYYGYYDDEFLPLIERTIEDMLIEVEPYSYSLEQQNSESSRFHNDYNPIELLNQAWQKFRDEPSSYSRWERIVVKEMLKTDSKSSDLKLNTKDLAAL